jgi:hypothetical protein
MSTTFPTAGSASKAATLKRNRKPIEPGSHLHPFLLHTVAGGLIQIPDPGGKLIHLQFLTIPFTMPLNWWSRHIVRLPRHEMTNVIAVTAATAILLDGFAMNRFPGLYGSDPAVIAGGAAWLLWAVGVALTLALVTASSSPRR